MKAIPTVIFLGPLVLVMAIRGRTLVTDTRMIPRFTAAALVAQFVGNVSFQISLGIIGLAAAVPITLGTLIVGGAMLGRLILGEPVRRRTIIAMVLLITAVVVLSLPEGTQPTEVTEDAGLPVWLGGVFAAASGAAYGLFGVVMRQTLTGGVTAPLTLLISGTVGTVSLWSLTYARMTIDDLSAVALQQWLTMFAAGLFNFAAFVALASSLKVLPVVAVNLINASQVAMAALAGVLLFAEPVTATLLAGIVLTVAGLVALANPRRPKLKRSAAN